MPGPLVAIPLRSVFFDGTTSQSKDLVRSLGNINRTWIDFFRRASDLIQQGTHTERLKLAPGGVPDGALFIETDRSAVYESRIVSKVSTWVLVLASMSDVLGNRPADLGANDAGFLFTSTTNNFQSRWTGTAWVTLTAAYVSQGTHAGRLALSAGTVPDGALFIETDRFAIYESRLVSAVPTWVLVLAFLRGLFAARPADLGLNDVGFVFSATDALDYRWDGAAWITLDTVRGGLALTNVGKLAKVGAAGVLAESAVTDDGTTVTLLARALKLNNAAITALQPLRVDASKVAITGPIDLGVAADVAGTGLTTIVKWDGTKLVDASGADFPVSSVNGQTGVVSLSIADIGDLSVASVSLVGQTASIGATNIPIGGGIAPAGLYRVSFYNRTTVASGTDTLATNIIHNDGVLSSTHTFTFSLSTTAVATGVASTSIVVKADGSNHIQYSTTRTGATGTPQYSVDIKVEKL